MIHTLFHNPRRFSVCLAWPPCWQLCALFTAARMRGPSLPEQEWSRVTEYTPGTRPHQQRRPGQRETENHVLQDWMLTSETVGECLKCVSREIQANFLEIGGTRTLCWKSRNMCVKDLHLYLISCLGTYVCLINPEQSYICTYEWLLFSRICFISQH